MKIKRGSQIISILFSEFPYSFLFFIYSFIYEVHFPALLYAYILCWWLIIHLCDLFGGKICVHLNYIKPQSRKPWNFWLFTNKIGFCSSIWSVRYPESMLSIDSKDTYFEKLLPNTPRKSLLIVSFFWRKLFIWYTQN